MGDVDRVAMRREKIGFTFQANNLVPYLTAVENVELMLRLNSRLDRPARCVPVSCWPGWGWRSA